MSFLPDSALLKDYGQQIFLFDLLPYFAANTLDLINQKYFDYNKTTHFSPRTTVSYPEFPNEYIENEIKAYIQYLALELHLKASSISYQLSCVVPRIVNFISKFYPEINSIIEIPYDIVFPHYQEYLIDCGVSLIHHSTKHVMGNLEVKSYPAKADILTSFTRYYRLVYTKAHPDRRKEKEKDIWDIRYLGIDYQTAVARPRYTLNFTKIQQKWLREAAKDYCFYRLQNRTMSAVIDDLKGLNVFSEFLALKQPDINALSELTRSTIEEYFAFLSLKGFVTSAYNRRISVLRTFFYIGNMLDLEGFPNKPLISLKDFRKNTALMPRYYSPTEIERINAHLDDLPIQIARMIFVLENCGMRLSDLCSATILINGKPSLQNNNSNEYIFTYYMPKTHRYNTIPIPELVGNILEEAIADSCRDFGAGCIYIFAKTADEPITTETFSNWANGMASKYKLTRDDGSPLRIRGHAFRCTLATEYANSGISLDVIRMMLGQKSMKVLEHYVNIHDITMVDALKPITLENERMIRSIGQSQPKVWEDLKEPTLIPLSNGRCAKAVETGICKHADMCYSCKMFHPLQECTDLYRKQLQDARANIVIAELHGYERILEANKRLEKELLAILTKLGEITDKKSDLQSFEQEVC